MPIVTLTTDWGNGDYYIGRLKGRILSCCPTATFADITHGIQPFNTLHAAFVIRHTYSSFPEGSIHLIGVNSEPSPANTITAVSVNSHYFIGSNDGMFSLIFDEEADEVIQLTPTEKTNGFKALELFTKAVKCICEQEPLSSIGLPTGIKKELTGKPVYDKDSISGLVIYIDALGNAITNISRELFMRVGKGRRFEILVQNNFTKIERISAHYDDVKYGSLVAIFNSFDMLEMAINRGNIAQLESLDTKSSIRVKFYD